MILHEYNLSDLIYSSISDLLFKLSMHLIACFWLEKFWLKNRLWHFASPLSFVCGLVPFLGVLKFRGLLFWFSYRKDFLWRHDSCLVAGVEFSVYHYMFFLVCYISWNLIYASKAMMKDDRARRSFQVQIKAAFCCFQSDLQEVMTQSNEPFSFWFSLFLACYEREECD